MCIKNQYDFFHIYHNNRKIVVVTFECKLSSKIKLQAKSYVTCNSSNLIYLITFPNCFITMGKKLPCKQISGLPHIELVCARK